MGHRKVGRVQVAFLGGAVVVAALVVFVLVWFQPQKLIIDDRVSEVAPVAAGGALVITLAEGALHSGEHSTTGTVRLLSLGDGGRVLRLVNLHTSNGPAVRVWLSATDARASDSAVDDAPHVDLGGLKGNIGSQNYALPRALDISQFRSVVIWCNRFHVGFGSAPLARPA
jgi:Electron transfer DM13